MSRLSVALVEPLTRKRIRHLGVTVWPDLQLMGPYTRAELFWGIFERTECRFIKRYLSGSDCVIELGAGIGATSAHIAAGLAHGATFVSLEANPAFVPMIERNIAPHVRQSRLQTTVKNVAISPDDGESVLMIAANPFVSRVGAAADGPIVAHVTVATRSLSSLVEEYGSGSIDLVCDIEGAEGDLIVRPGRSGLESCRRVIIELHGCAIDGVVYSPDDLLTMLRTRGGFSVLDRKGSVAALARNGRSYRD
jgi:FkbM family methyltransferase